MRNIIVGMGVAWCIMSCQAAHSDGPEPTCSNCPGTYISANEISEYLKEGDRRKTDRSASARCRHRQSTRRHRLCASRKA